MQHQNTIGVDLATSTIQVSIVTARGKETTNKALTRRPHTQWTRTRNL